MGAHFYSHSVMLHSIYYLLQTVAVIPAPFQTPSPPPHWELGAAIEAPVVAPGIIRQSMWWNPAAIPAIPKPQHWS
jgi:hypothetical protein